LGLQKLGGTKGGKREGELTILGSHKKLPTRCNEENHEDREVAKGRKDSFAFLTSVFERT